MDEQGQVGSSQGLGSLNILNQTLNLYRPHYSHIGLVEILGWERAERIYAPSSTLG